MNAGGLKITKQKCKYCGIGQIVVNKEKGIKFCSVCGHEFKK